MNKLTPMSIVKHFKGDMYVVIGVADDTETGIQSVVYRPLQGDRKLYTRQLGMFTSDVDIVKYPDCEQQERFKFISSFKDYVTANS